MLGTNEIPHLDLSERNEISDKHVFRLFFQVDCLMIVLSMKKMNDVFIVVRNSLGGIGLIILRGQNWENPFC